MKSKKELVFCDDCAFRIASLITETCSNYENGVKNVSAICISWENGNCYKVNRKNDCKYYVKKEEIKPTLILKILNKILN